MGEGPGLGVEAGGLAGGAESPSPVTNVAAPPPHPALSPVEGQRAPGVSVVMVVYRTGPALERTLAHALADPGVDELILVDNGSTPEEAAWLDAAAARDPRVTLLRGQGNVGFARGANMGAEAAGGPVLVFLNPDAFLRPGCLPALAEALAVCTGGPCLAGARVLDHDGREQRGARRGEVTPVTTLLSLTRLAHLPGLSRFEVHHEADALPAGPAPVPTVSGACFAMRRADFTALGGFDTGFFLHVEDVDLCWRVRRAGGQVLFQPRAEVTHLGSTSRTHPVRVEFHKGVGLARYFRKRADTPARRALAYALTPAIIGVNVLRPLLRRVGGRGWLR